MSLLINDLVTHAGLEPSGRLIRISRIEPWPVVTGTQIVEGDTSRCHGKMIVFDRLVPAPPARIDELRIAGAEEISRAARLGLLPPEVDTTHGEPTTPAIARPGTHVRQPAAEV